MLLLACSIENNEEIISCPTNIDKSDVEIDITAVYADINFSNWKVTLPIDENNNGSPDEYKLSELINSKYRTNTPIKPYMYDDVEGTSIEFCTTPGISTANSSYSRAELRELINPSRTRINWPLNTEVAFSKVKYYELEVAH